MRLTAVQNDRAAGVLLATAAGDALGAGYEFTYPAADAKIDMIGGGLGPFAPGEWTDDTSMALAIAEISATGADIGRGAGLDAVAAQFRHWYGTDPKDIGNQTRAVLRAAGTTATAMQARARSLPGRTGGNGSLMRTAPVGLAYLEDAERCLAAAHEISTLTHADEQASEACRVWSFAVRHAVLHGTFDGVRVSLRHLSPPAAQRWAALLDEAETATNARVFDKNGWVVHALQAAWWAITHARADGPGHLQEALELAVRAGNDTDTVAAIAGGLLGARWGASAVPARWRRMLHGWPGYRSRDLVRLGLHTAWGGSDDDRGWPTAPEVDYSRYRTDRRATHPHDEGVVLGGAELLRAPGFDAVVSLCRVGPAPHAAEHVEFWMVDADHSRNQHLVFTIDDAARTVRALRGEGKTVAVHCVEGVSRTPSVAARYSMLLGRDPGDVLRVMPWAEPRPALWWAATEGRPAACT
ncbi:ADP-ribosylglycohydrolase family protein [Rhodococcus sp. CH91]|uniref:ADP-ribosylglycohydrolase family protein n=1 Tax=Rhodococcus sp. CH91 TaxID=2910256 RepID=UPI001F4A2813|nr:ADP-ribosylglycohydrolase family protein [Rhodococcus sp. CH91]